VLNNILENLNFIFTQLRFRDLIDMVLVWIVVYRVLILIRHTGTVQMLSGLGILAIAYLMSIWFELFTFNWILEKFFNNLFLIVVILFQGEIRRALAHIGSNPFFTGTSHVQETHIVEEIAKGAIQLAQRGIGALIVIEREINLEYFIELGTELDSAISAELFNSIFHPAGPLHDGAVIIRSGRCARDRDQRRKQLGRNRRRRANDRGCGPRETPPRSLRVLRLEISPPALRKSA